MGLEQKKSLIVNLVMILVLTMPAVFGFNLLKNIQPMGAGSTIMDLEDFLVSSNLLPLGSLVGVLFCVRKTAGDGRTSSRKPTLARASISLTDFAATCPTLCLHLYASSILKATMTHSQTEVCRSL